MQLEHAEHTLETIRTLMDRSQRYEHISGYSGLVAGSAVLTGCAALAGHWLPYAPQTCFLVVWSVVFAVAATAHGLLTFARARRRDEPVWSRQARTVLLAVLPSFVASLAVSVALWRADHLEMLPALWLMFYGCGALATGFFAPRSIARLGMICLGLAITGLLVLPDAPLLTMALGFGMTHLGFGVCVLTTERREAREQAFWTNVQRLAGTETIE